MYLTASQECLEFEETLQLKYTVARRMLCRRHLRHHLLEHETRSCRIERSLKRSGRLNGSHKRSGHKRNRHELASFLTGLRWRYTSARRRNRKAWRCEAVLHLQTLAQVDTLGCLLQPLYRDHDGDWRSA